MRKYQSWRLCWSLKSLAVICPSCLLFARWSTVVRGTLLNALLSDLILITPGNIVPTLQVRRERRPQQYMVTLLVSEAGMQTSSNSRTVFGRIESPGCVYYPHSTPSVNHTVTSKNTNLNKIIASEKEAKNWMTGSVHTFCQVCSGSHKGKINLLLTILVSTKEKPLFQDYSH